MSIVITSPIVNPAVRAKAPLRSSTAVPKTAHTKKNVNMASSTTAFPTANPSATAGMPPVTASNAGRGSMYFKKNAAARPPSSSATM